MIDILDDHIDRADQISEKRPNTDIIEEEPQPKKHHNEDISNLPEDFPEENQLDKSVIELLEVIDAYGQPRGIIETTCDPLIGNEWLKGSQITFWLLDLKGKYPHIQGLQDPGLYVHDSFEPNYTGLFVQVINVSQNHWICVSNYKCEPTHLNIYDSMNTSFTQNKIEGIKKILKKMRPGCASITVNVKQVQSQKNSDDCGLFSLAYSQLICNDQDPTQFEFFRQRLRPHFNECIQNNNFTTSPHVEKPTARVNRRILSVF